MTDTYKIIRYYNPIYGEKRPRKIMGGLTLEEAEEQCSKESTHKKDKKGNVEWFDGYTRE